jgi:hypothetical protein
MKQILEKFPDADFPSITIDVLSAIKFKRSPLHSLGPHNLRALIQLMLNVEIGTYPEVLKSAVCQTVYPELNGLTVYHVQSATKSDLPSQFSHVAGFNILNLLNVHHPKFVKSLQYKYTAEAKNSGVSQFTPAHYFWIDTDALNIYHKGIVNFNSEFPTPEQFKEVSFSSHHCSNSFFASFIIFRQFSPLTRLNYLRLHGVTCTNLPPPFHLCLRHLLLLLQLHLS